LTYDGLCQRNASGPQSQSSYLEIYSCPLLFRPFVFPYKKGRNSIFYEKNIKRLYWTMIHLRLNVNFERI